jgi:hypothetical protein
MDDLAPSALSLLVAWIAANHIKLAVPAHELAVFANALHTGPNFHGYWLPRGA